VKANLHEGHELPEDDDLDEDLMDIHEAKDILKVFMEEQKKGETVNNDSQMDTLVLQQRFLTVTTCNCI
jgi:hypothetical protein